MGLASSLGISLRGLGPKHDPNQKQKMHIHDPNNPHGELSPQDVQNEINAYVDMLIDELAEFEETGIDPRFPNKETN